MDNFQFSRNLMMTCRDILKEQRSNGQSNFSPYSLLHCTKSKQNDDSMKSFLTLNGDLLLEDQKQQL